MKKEQTVNKTKLQFTRKAVARLGNTDNGAQAYITATVTVTLITLTQRCCAGEDSSRSVTREV